MDDAWGSPIETLKIRLPPAASYRDRTTLRCFQPPQTQDAHRATAHCNGVMTFVLEVTAFPRNKCPDSWILFVEFLIPSWKNVSISISISISISTSTSTSISISISIYLSIYIYTHIYIYIYINILYIIYYWSGGTTKTHWLVPFLTSSCRWAF